MDDVMKIVRELHEGDPTPSLRALTDSQLYDLNRLGNAIRIAVMAEANRRVLEAEASQAP